MSGIGGSEFLLLCLIGLLILGPERLPRVASQIGSWVGRARQMARTMQRQLAEEVDMEKNLGINPKDFHPETLLTPRDDDTYSPLHDELDGDKAVEATADHDDQAAVTDSDDAPEEKTA